MSRGVLIIRAEQEQSALELKLRERGLDAYCHSMVDINALTPSDTDKATWLNNQWHGVIAVSPNATRFFDRMLGDTPWPKAKKHYFAVGPGTGEPLLNVAKQPVTWPTTEHNSTALLQLPELQDVKDEHWLIINGAPGRSIIPDTLAERGAQVTIASVYERVPKANDAAQIPTDWFEQIDRILVSSKEQAELLTAYLKQAGQSDWASACQWVVPSERIAEVIRDFGVPSANIHFAMSAMADDLVAATIRIKTVKPMSDKTMPEQEKKKVTKPKAQKESRFWSKFFIFILFLSVITLGVGGWYLWQQQSTMLSQTEQEFDKLRSRLSNAQRTDAEFEARLTARLQQDTEARLARQNEQQQAAVQDLHAQQENHQARLRQQLIQQEESIVRLSQRVRATENRHTEDWLLNEAYTRVNLAVQRLSVEGDAAIALNLLRAAKDVLQEDAVNYQTIIDQLDRDIDMIAAVPTVDYSGVIVFIQNLQKQVGDLETLTGNPAQNESDTATDVSADVADWRSNLANAWKALSADLVRIEKKTDLPLRINQEQRLALLSRVELQLQLAQQALIRKQQEVYTATLAETHYLVSHYFEQDNPRTKQFLSALGSVKDLNIITEFPTSLLSRAMLRERLHDLESTTAVAPENAND